MAGVEVHQTPVDGKRRFDVPDACVRLSPECKGAAQDGVACLQVVQHLAILRVARHDFGECPLFPEVTGDGLVDVPAHQRKRGKVVVGVARRILPVDVARVRDRHPAAKRLILDVFAFGKIQVASRLRHLAEIVVDVVKVLCDGVVSGRKRQRVFQRGGRALKAASERSSLPSLQSVSPTHSRTSA